MFKKIHNKTSGKKQCTIQNKMWNYVKKSNEFVDYYPTISAQETKQTNKVIY